MCRCTGAKADCPIGVQFVARNGDEMTLLKLAAELEDASPWMTADRRFSKVTDMRFAEYDRYDGWGSRN